MGISGYNRTSPEKEDKGKNEDNKLPAAVVFLGARSYIIIIL